MKSLASILTELTYENKDLLKRFNRFTQGLSNVDMFTLILLFKHARILKTIYRGLKYI